MRLMYSTLLPGLFCAYFIGAVLSFDLIKVCGSVLSVTNHFAGKELEDHYWSGHYPVDILPSRKNLEWNICVSMNFDQAKLHN